MSHRRLPNRPPRTPTAHELEVAEIIANGRAERAAQRGQPVRPATPQPKAPAQAAVASTGGRRFGQ
jgi:hypothetical protein